MHKTIMIVEDEQPFHDLYKAMLEGTDYRIISVYDGDEALSRLQKEKPDLIILDLLLDMMPGDTLFLYLKNTPEYTDIPVIIVSSFPKRDYKNLRDIDPGLIFLNKTATREELIGKIKTKIG